ncbi:MAG: glycosyltransferase [Alphaproteobacteria bacterium]|nr:glycosyltransferase [Alphaproteobacteria bacterium]
MTPPDAPALLLDVQDLLKHLDDYGSVSGIQRVQLGILASIIHGQAGPLGGCCRMVFGRLEDGTLHSPRPEDMAAILEHCTTTHDHDAARELVARARANAAPCEARAGDALLVLGAFWFFAGAPGFLAGLKRQGLRLGVLVYDMFPATHPEFATEDTVRYFNQALNEGLLFWDFALAISEFSAAEFRRVAAARGFPEIPVIAVPLAHSFGMAAPQVPAWLDTFPQSMQDIRDRDFVLVVCTVEVRKNHLLLFHAWQRMIAEGDNPPVLIFAGRIGWGVRDLMAQLDATRCLDGRIMLARDLSDIELAAMYRACLFTVFPSHGEGWGLAVGESLAFGKACIAAGVTAVPEVGGELVTYADPGSVPEWVARLRAWLHDRGALRAAEARIAQQFVPRQWPDVARHVVEAALDLAATPRMVAVPDAALAPRLGQSLPIGASFAMQGGLREAREAIAQALSFAAGWYPVETACTWMREARAELVLGCDAPPGSIIAATLRLRASPWDAENPLTLEMEGGPAVTHAPVPGSVSEVTCYGQVSEQGGLRIILRASRRGREHPDDPRRLSYGIEALLLEPRDELPPPPLALLPPVLVVPPRPEPPPAPLPRGLAGLAQRLWAPLRHARLRADTLRAQGQWQAAAEGYRRFLHRRPHDEAMRMRLAECLARAGDIPAAQAALEAMTGPTGAASAEAARLAETRAAGAPVLFVDLSALLGPAEWCGSWAARRWAQGLARALLARPGCFALVTAAHAPFPCLLADWMPAVLLDAPWPSRAARLHAVLDGLPRMLPRARETTVLLAPPMQAEPWRHASHGGAILRLALAEPAMLHAPHHVPQQVAAALAAAQDILLALTGLPVPGADAGMDCQAPPPPTGAIICDAAAPWLDEALALLAQAGVALPPVVTMPTEDLCLAPMLRHARLAISTAPPGSWPAMRLAALAAGLPCLAVPDDRLGAAPPVMAPHDAQGTAAALRRLLEQPAAAMALAMAQRIDAAALPIADWAMLAEAVIAGTDAATMTASPGLAGQWALNAGAGAP